MTDTSCTELPGAGLMPAPVDLAAIDRVAHPGAIEHLVIVGHPSTDSFCHALARAYAEAVAASGQAATVRDLYAGGFDPLLKADERPHVAPFRIAPDVEAELALVRRARVVVLVYPIWFGMPSAIITGYINRVLGAGLSARQLRDAEPHPLLGGKRLVLLTTSATTVAWLAERGQWYGISEAFDDYLTAIFSFAGSTHEHFDAVVTPLLASYADECLVRAAACATSTCALLLAEAHRAQAHRKLTLWGHPLD